MPLSAKSLRALCLLGLLVTAASAGAETILVTEGRLFGRRNEVQFSLSIPGRVLAGNSDIGPDWRAPLPEPRPGATLDFSFDTELLFAGYPGTFHVTAPPFRLSASPDGSYVQGGPFPFSFSGVIGEDDDGPFYDLIGQGTGRVFYDPSSYGPNYDLTFETPVVTPEPSSIVLLGIGLFGAAARRFRSSRWD